MYIVELENIVEQVTRGSRSGVLGSFPKLTFLVRKPNYTLCLSSAMLLRAD